MRKRFKYPLTFVGILICALIFIGICYFFYDRFTDDALVLADNNLSINFINGNEFNNRHNKKLKFTVINTSDETSYYYIRFNEVAGSASYSLSGIDNDINVSNDLRSGVVSSFIEIKGNEIQNYVIKFDGNGKYSGVININKEANNYDTFADILIKSFPPKKELISELGEASTTDEGLNISKDDSGTTYFFRGDISNNYVSFADMIWRVVRINGDGSVRLVLNNLLDDNIAYYNVGGDYIYSGSNVKNYLEEYYKKYLRDYSDYISINNFCNDITTSDNNFTAYNRVIVDKIITFNCLSEKYSSTIGLLTIDEVIAAGSNGVDTNTNYYLYNNKINKDYYVMSSYKRENDDYYPFVVKTAGNITYGLGTNSIGIRPVINIIKNVTVTGNGSIDNPYVIKNIAYN